MDPLTLTTLLSTGVQLGSSLLGISKEKKLAKTQQQEYLKQLEQNRRMELQNRIEAGNSVRRNFPTLGVDLPMFAYGGYAPNVEAEGNEIVTHPAGAQPAVKGGGAAPVSSEATELLGASHAQGGIPVGLEPGSVVWSDRTKPKSQDVLAMLRKLGIQSPEKKTFAQIVEKLETRRGSMEKLPGKTTRARNSKNLMLNNLDSVEQSLAQEQQAVNPQPQQASPLPKAWGGFIWDPPKRSAGLQPLEMIDYLIKGDSQPAPAGDIFKDGIQRTLLGTRNTEPVGLHNGKDPYAFNPKLRGEVLQPLDNNPPIEPASDSIKRILASTPASHPPAYTGNTEDPWSFMPKMKNEVLPDMQKKPFDWNKGVDIASQALPVIGSLAEYFAKSNATKKMMPPPRPVVTSRVKLNKTLDIGRAFSELNKSRATGVAAANSLRDSNASAALKVAANRNVDQGVLDLLEKANNYRSQMENQELQTNVGIDQANAATINAHRYGLTDFNTARTAAKANNLTDLFTKLQLYAKDVKEGKMDLKKYQLLLDSLSPEVRESLMQSFKFQ